MSLFKKYKAKYMPCKQGVCMYKERPGLQVICANTGKRPKDMNKSECLMIWHFENIGG